MGNKFHMHVAEDINFKSARKLKEDLDASIQNIGEGLCSSTPKAAAPPKLSQKL